MQHYLLSPHFDDAVLSCGGTIAVLAERGEAVTVLTLFGGEPVPPYSPFAQKLHARWGAPRNVVRLRRAEDTAALARLDARAQHEQVPDAIYRRDRQGNWLYANEEALSSGSYHPSEEWITFYLCERVAATVGSLDCRLYAPLGIGGHVDHVIAFDTGRLLHAAGYEVLFYEDFPYVLRDKASYQQRIEHLEGWTPEITTFSEPCLLLKIEAFQYYRSQLTTVFPDTATIAEPFRRWAMSVSGSDQIAGERYWRAPRERASQLQPST
jgi:hypothetical protein